MKTFDQMAVGGIGEDITLTCRNGLEQSLVQDVEVELFNIVGLYGVVEKSSCAFYVC